MKETGDKSLPRSRNRGIALVLTLGILAIVTLMVVAFAISMRVDMMASRNFNDAIRARQFADTGAAEAIALLSAQTPNLDPSHYYVTQPGRVVMNSYSLGNDLLFSTYTGLGALSTNINCDGSIDSGGSTILVDWIPIIVTNTAATNFVGRFCYWVDDEASKININTANQRVNLLNPMPSDVDLTVLAGIDPTKAGASYTFATNYVFVTPASWPLTTPASTITPADYTNNEFYITVYSVDTNLTPWGDARVNLNAANALSNIVSVLTNAALTTWFNQDFAGKYGQNLLNQIAANIIDYGTAGDNATTDSQTAPNYCGLKAVPYVNEILGTASVDAVNSNASIGIAFELVNPYPSAKGTNYTIEATYTLLAAALPSLPAANSVTNITISTGVPAGGYLPPPSYITVYNVTNDPTIAGLSSPVAVQVVFSKIRLLNAAGNLVDYAYNLTNPPTAGASVPTNNTPTVFAIGDCDPRAHRSMTMVNPLTGGTVYLWGSEAPGSHSFYASQPLAAIPTDLTDDGTESGATQATNSNYNVKEGQYASVGELGYIHTGIPWRSLRLQPRGAGNNIPDWVLLDLFSTTSGSVTGRININAQIDDLLGGSGAIRSAPLQALLNGTPLVGLTNNIRTNAWVTTWSTSWTALTNAAPLWTSFSNVYAFAGQVCEVNQVANVGGTDASREGNLASIINLITTRSDTFTVWAWGQALQEVKNGTVVLGTNVVGEAKVQAVVQRGANNRYRVLYYRYLNP